MERHISTKGQASRARLLESAKHLFANKGYQQTKVSDIVKAAGLTQAAFYLYFTSKDAIFAELVDEFRQQTKLLANNFRQLAKLSPPEIPAQIVSNLKGIFTYLSSNPELTRIAWFESPEAETIKNEIIQLVTGNLAGNQAAGHIRQRIKPAFVAEFVIGAVDRLTNKWLLTGEKTPDELAEEMADLVMNGILVRPNL
ncbi:TetR/AcrR family transcriptional regulator [Brevibacillus ginsengisoli]|uniref:TetR/AcrR family transcriptional regulator n=1 Tax=Brevibacillus ginsengisoli TaxID=363854 RepID=UPI003CF146E8